MFTLDDVIKAFEDYKTAKRDYWNEHSNRQRCLEDMEDAERRYVEAVTYLIKEEA